MYTLHLFAGAGGGILADLLLGHTPIGAVEIEDYPRRVLLQRQLDGILPVFPIWDDVKTFRADNPETSGFIERCKSVASELVICGGFPCQDISSAGKGKGLSGERSGLWSEMARIISEIRPRFAFVENSPMLVSRGLNRVLGDISEMGYDSKWGIVSAENAGAVHKRERIWILADSSKVGFSSDSTIHFKKFIQTKSKTWSADSNSSSCTWKLHEPIDDAFSYRKHNDVAESVDRVNSLGNGQVPDCAALAWRILSGQNEEISHDTSRTQAINKRSADESSPESSIAANP